MAGERSELSNQSKRELSYLDRFRDSTRRRTRRVNRPKMEIPTDPNTPLPTPEIWPTAEEFRTAFKATKRKIGPVTGGFIPTRVIRFKD